MESARVRDDRDRCPVARMCRLHGVSRSGCLQWCARPRVHHEPDRSWVADITGAQLRGTGQVLQRQQRDRLPDLQDRARCLERAAAAGGSTPDGRGGERC